MTLSPLDKLLLEELQNDFPLVLKPYKKIAEKLNIPESTVLEKIKTLYSEKIIRNISVVINSGKIGFQSTLVAAKVKEINIENVIKNINKHSGVSHNYLRDHEYNIWFTITVKKNIDLLKEIETLLNAGENNVDDYIILSSAKTFKIGVNFRFSEKKYDSDYKEISCQENEPDLSYDDKRIINELQNGLNIIHEPWKIISSALNISEEFLFNRIDYLKKSGIIRKICAAINHRKAGINYNMMCCFNIPESQVLSSGIEVSLHPQVTHCYWRKPVYGKWEYPLFAMVHAEIKGECESIAENIAKKINCRDYVILNSTKELKKEKRKYIIILKELKNPLNIK